MSERAPFAGSPSRVCFASELFRVGTFRAAPDHPMFSDSGPARGHLFVFPRSSVRIERREGESFVADPTVATFYNRGDLYARRAIDRDGDRCDWFEPEARLLAEAIAQFDAAVVDRPMRPFRFARGPSRARCYTLQRAVFHHVTSGETADPLWIEETLLQVLRRLLADTYALLDRPSATRPASLAAVDLAEDLKTWVVDRLDERLTLTSLGRALGASPFQICRQFRAATGASVHGYLTDLRLRRALERVAEPKSDLAAVAVDLGFASHSHFTTVFRSRFGVTPSGFRRGLSERRRRELADLLDLD